MSYGNLISSSPAPEIRSGADRVLRIGGAVAIPHEQARLVRKGRRK
jgi:hypothetical protein